MDSNLNLEDARVFMDDGFEYNKNNQEIVLFNFEQKNKPWQLVNLIINNVKVYNLERTIFNFDFTFIYKNEYYYYSLKRYIKFKQTHEMNFSIDCTT